MYAIFSTKYDSWVMEFDKTVSRFRSYDAAEMWIDTAISEDHDGKYSDYIAVYILEMVA